MIDFGDEIAKMKPININASDFNHNHIPQKIYNSIVFYNKSIDKLKTKEIDSAISNLRKSLFYNKSFFESIKLLGLCYAYNNEFKKAEKYFKKLDKYNMYQTASKDYLKELNTQKVNFQALNAIRNLSSKSNTQKRAAVFSKKIAVLILVLITAAGLLALVYKMQPNIQAALSNIKDPSPKTSTVPEQNNVNDEKYSKLNANYISLQDNLNTTKSELDNYKNKYNALLELNDAENFYKNGDYEKAIDILKSLKNADLDTTLKAKYDTLWNNIKSNTVWTIYNQANNLYKQGKYSDALPKLKRVEGIAPDEQLMPWILYQIGMCYRNTNDSSNAFLYFQKVKTNYPSSNYAKYADNIIGNAAK